MDNFWATVYIILIAASTTVICETWFHYGRSEGRDEIIKLCESTADATTKMLLECSKYE